MRKAVKIIKRRLIHKSEHFTLVRDRVKWPNGRVVGKDLLVHPGVAVIVPVVDKNHLILIRQFRYGPRGFLWEVPAGTLDEGETPLECAKREIEEEIGYRARRWRKLGVCYVAPSASTELVHAFAAFDLVKTRSSREEDEIIYPRIISFDRAKRMLERNMIRDAKTIAALYFCFKMRKMC